MNSVDSVNKMIMDAVLKGVQFLGFDMKANKAQHKLDFTPTMFSKPNLKGFEVLVHFLLSQLDPKRAELEFGKCWPILLKEQQAEFKQTVLKWLDEIAGKVEKQGIQFPKLANSNLVAPSGFKVCSLLFELHMHVYKTKLAESHELGKKLMNRACTFDSSLVENNKQPFSQSRMVNSTAGYKTTQMVKVTYKQLKHYKYYSAAIEKATLHETDVFSTLLAKYLAMKNKYAEMSETSLQNINRLLNEKQQRTESLNKIKLEFMNRLKKSKLMNMKEGQSLNDACLLVKQLIEEQFHAKWREFTSNVYDQTYNNQELKSNIDDVVKGNENENELNGQDLIATFNQLSPDLNPEEILKNAYLYSGCPNFLNMGHIGAIVDENRTKLDLINATRFYKLILEQQSSLLIKLDVEKLNTLASFLNDGVCDQSNSELLIETINDNTNNGDFMISIKTINDDIAKIKSTLEFFVKKLTVEYERLYRDMKSECSMSRTASEMNRQDEEAVKAIKMLEEVEKLNKKSIDINYINQMKEIAKKSSELKLDDESKSNTDQSSGYTSKNPLVSSTTSTHSAKQSKYDLLLIDHEPQSNPNIVQSNRQQPDQNNSFEILNLNENDWNLNLI